jgi:hypothetical protein
MNDPLSAENKRKAGHYEVVGETLAKYEFYEVGWNPYQRFLDIDKTDFILRRRNNNKIEYREIQVKYGKLYDCGTKREQTLFDITSWRFFAADAFESHLDRKDFFIAYVLAHDTGYEGDIFIFSAKEFHGLIASAIPSGSRMKMYLSRDKSNPEKWYLRRKTKFTDLSNSNCLDVSQHRRAFHKLN